MPIADTPTLLPLPFHKDSRGVFSKPYAESRFGGDFVIRELYWTNSLKGVVRGMHFQVPPDDVNKIVWVSRGSILDVVVDLHPGDRYGAVSSFPLDTSGVALWIPSGFAHGFQALEDDSIVNYAVDAEYSPEHDKGVAIDYPWPLPVTTISDRDKTFPSIHEFLTPFGA